MRKLLESLLGEEFAWWQKLKVLHRVYVVYFVVSMMMVLGLTDGNSIWVIAAVLLNFYNSARLIGRVPTR